MPDPLSEVDEVWLALTHSLSTLQADSHTPNPVPNQCRYCYTMYLVQRGLDAYKRRHNIGMQ